LLLCEQKVLREPMLYLSLYFKTHRQYYYELLGNESVEKPDYNNDPDHWCLKRWDTSEEESIIKTTPPWCRFFENNCEFWKCQNAPFRS